MSLCWEARHNPWESIISSLPWICLESSVWLRCHFLILYFFLRGSYLFLSIFSFLSSWSANYYHFKNVFELFICCITWTFLQITKNFSSKTVPVTQWCYTETLQLRKLLSLVPNSYRYLLLCIQMSTTWLNFQNTEIQLPHVKLQNSPTIL